jgi:kinesin family protein 2/24
VGPAPYDAEDPRTWDHDATIAWLTAQFTERTQEFRWIAAASKASAQEEIDLGVDINKICPAGSTAKNLGMLYTPQFVERCLEARTGALKPDELKLVATETIGCLFYLILVGKHKKRNEIMHTRKEVVGNSYGMGFIGRLVNNISLVVRRRHSPGSQPTAASSCSPRQDDRNCQAPQFLCALPNT